MAKPITDTELREMFITVFEQFEVYDKALASIADSVQRVLRDLEKRSKADEQRKLAQAELKNLDDVRARLSQHAVHGDKLAKLKAD